MYHDATQRKEGAEINASLYALKECVRLRRLRALGERAHIPYRNSCLTRVIMPCLMRDDAGIVVIGTLSPSAADTEHSVATLKTVLLIGGNDNATPMETKEDVPKGLSWDGDGVVRNHVVKRAIPPGQWAYADIVAWLARVKGGAFAGGHVPEGLSGRELVRMTPHALARLLPPAARRGHHEAEAAKALFHAIRDEVARVKRANDPRRR
mmetsp:Transcript_56845/g.133839  ORF Transcript_56845/g.133839 Transcript_56845/m.133839 type:complete len:209 (+) Transcript_56845:125-751(+)